MDRKTIFTKTAKGLMEASGKTSILSRDLRNLLKEVDGRLTVADLQQKAGKVPEATPGACVGLVLSGGNVDPELFARVLRGEY